MTKQDITYEVAKELHITTKEAKPLVEEVIEFIKASIENGINVEISGFGKFIIRQKNKRIGRNPKTGIEAEISSRKVVTFKPSTILRKAVNNNDAK